MIAREVIPSEEQTAIVGPLGIIEVPAGARASLGAGRPVAIEIPHFWVYVDLVGGSGGDAFTFQCGLSALGFPDTELLEYAHVWPEGSQRYRLITDVPPQIYRLVDDRLRFVKFRGVLDGREVVGVTLPVVWE